VLWHTLRYAAVTPGKIEEKMKREVSRESALPAFSLEIGDLELLWGRLLALFDKPGDVYCSIDIKLPSESLEFKNISELKEYSALLGRITKFRLWLSQGGRRISIRSASFLGTRPEVSATADSEAWCAGAVETVRSFTQANRLWYSWFVSAPIGWIFVVFANIPNIASVFLPKGEPLDRPVFATWLSITITIAILYLVRGKLLPSSVLVVTPQDGFIRRHLGELSLLVAIVSAILTVLGWFFAK
jgi:hypothetical protein